MAFVIILILALMFLAMGWRSAHSETPVGFWANDPNRPEVSDVTAYNRAVGILWGIYGLLLALCSIPLLFSSDAAVIITILGIVFSSLFLITVYAAVIEPKYRK